MTVGEFQAFVAEHGVPPETPIRVDAFGGMRSGKEIAQARVGFDWDAGTVVLVPEVPLTIYRGGAKP